MSSNHASDTDQDSTADHHLGKVIAITIAAAVGGFLFGFDSSVINGAVDSISSTYSLGGFMTGFSVAIALIGCAIGAWFAGRLADAWGRRRVMVIGAVLFVVSSIGTGLAFSVPDLIFWRVVGGLGVGIASVIAPAYIAEISPARYRGSLGSLQQLAITLGIVTALFSDYALQDAAGGASEVLFLGQEAWRWMFIVGVIPALVYGVLAFLIPESPRYLVSKDEIEKARRILRDVSGDADPKGRIQQIRQSLKREKKVSLADLRGDTFGLHGIVWVGIWIAILQQFVGINVIFYYSTTLWKSVGFSESQSFQTSAITGAINVVMTFAAIAFVDKIGRRRLLKIGSAGMALGLVATAVAFTQQQGTGDNVTLPDQWGTVALIGANLFVVAFAASWGPVMWVMLGEMFPNSIRGVALGVCTAVNWIANFTISLLFPFVSETLGLVWVYGFFALCAAASFGYVHWKVPETNGVELEDMKN